MGVNITDLFVLINATWSALHVPSVQLDPVSERIVRDVDAVIFSGGCPLNCCEAPETALAYTGGPFDAVPPACKEARQIGRCTSMFGADKEDACIAIVTDADADARRHNKPRITRAAKTKRAALTQRLQFLLDDLSAEVAAYNTVRALESPSNGGSGVGPRL